MQLRLWVDRADADVAVRRFADEQLASTILVAKAQPRFSRIGILRIGKGGQTERPAWSIVFIEAFVEVQNVFIVKIEPKQISDSSRNGSKIVRSTSATQSIDKNFTPDRMEAT